MIMLACALPVAGSDDVMRLSLADSINLVLRQNQGLQAQKHWFEASEARVAERRAQKTSDLYATASANQETYATQNLVSAVSYTTSQTGFTYSHLLGDSRTMRHDLFSDESLAAHTHSDLALLRMKVILQVKSGYWSMLSALKREQIEQARVKRFAAISDIARTRQRIGFGDRLESGWAAVQYGLAQDALTEAKDDIEQSRIEFRQLLGLPPDAEFDLTDGLSYSWESAQDLLNSSPSNRTDPAVLAARRDVEQAIADKQFARSQWWPQASITGVYNSPTGRNGSVSLDSDWRFTAGANYPLRYNFPIYYQNAYTALLNLSYLLYDGGKQATRLQRANDELATAESHLNDIETTLAQQLASARLSLAKSISRVHYLEGLETAASENATAARMKYQRNRLPLAQLIEVESDWVITQRTYIEALYDLNVAAEQLSRQLLINTYGNEAD